MHTSQKGFSLNYGIVMLMIVNDCCELKSVEKLVNQKRLGMYIFVESAVKL